MSPTTRLGFQRPRSEVTCHEGVKCRPAEVPHDENEEVEEARSDATPFIRIF